MAEVDADDDNIRRFVVMHYRYDRDRHERRNMVVAAFDNETEFQARIDEFAEALRTRRADGDLEDARERISGVRLEAGHRARQANARLLQRAIEHGVAFRSIADLAVPPNVAMIQFNRTAGD